MAEILNLIPDLSTWPGAMLGIVAIICATITAGAKYAHRIAGFLEFWDERQRQRFIRKIQANCPHQWMFMHLVPRDGIYDLETVTACVACGLEMPTETVAYWYRTQYAAFLAWYQRK